MQRIGILADTHGLLRPEALQALEGCEHIIHAGDVGTPEVLERLRTFAPLTAIRGNVDRGPWADSLPETATIDLGGCVVHVLHDRSVLLPGAAHPDWRVVVSGHSHHPSIEEQAGSLWINPGSAGPRRFRLPITVARLEVDQSGELTARLITLAVTPPVPGAPRRKAGGKTP